MRAPRLLEEYPYAAERERSPTQGRSIAWEFLVSARDAEMLRHMLASGESVYVSNHHA